MFGNSPRKTRNNDLERAEVAMFNHRSAEMLGDKGRIIDRTLAEVEVAKLRSAQKAQAQAKQRRGWFGNAA